MASASRARIFTATSGTEWLADVFVPSPSGLVGVRLVGDRPPNEYVLRTLIHELARIPLEGVRRRRPGSWALDSAPSWFVQGLEEWLARTLSSEWELKVRLPDSIRRVKADPSRIRFDGAIRAASDYDDGAAIVACMHTAWGKARVHAILRDDGTAFEGAIERSLGVDMRGLHAKVVACASAQP